MSKRFQTNWRGLCVAVLGAGTAFAPGAEPPRNVTHSVPQGPLPRRVHVFEDFETDIEKRWWLRGVPETNNVPPSLSATVPNRRALRATTTKDFDDKMDDATKGFKAVVFKGNTIHDTRADSDRKQTTGIALEEGVGEVQADGNTIDAVTAIQDKRKKR